MLSWRIKKYPYFLVESYGDGVWAGKDVELGCGQERIWINI